MKKLVTKTENRKASKAKASKAKAKASVKRVSKASRKANGKANGTASKPKKASRKGGGKALTDFGNASKLKVLNGKEIPSRSNCFKTGQTVSACLAAQKVAGFRGRRKFIRAQIAQNRISLS